MRMRRLKLSEAEELTQGDTAKKDRAEIKPEQVSIRIPMKPLCCAAFWMCLHNNEENHAKQHISEHSFCYGVD